jgi:hypothetical protein
MGRAKQGMVCALLVAIGGLTLVSCQIHAKPLAKTGTPRLVMLAPGTIVDGELSSHWSARVIRSVPRLASGKIATLPGSAKKSATLFRTVILADVARGDAGYWLRSVGVGNAIPFSGHEVVVTPDGPDDARETLSTIESLVCKKAFEELGRGRLVAATPTFALLRTPARLVVRGKHEEVDLYYGMLIDPQSGDLRTLNWATLPGHRKPPSQITLLPPDDAFDCGLDVTVTRTLGPWSVAWSFAMASLPPGRRIAVTAAASDVIKNQTGGDGDVVALEKAIRGLLKARRAKR